MELEEKGDKVRVFRRTWDMNIFRRVCVATLDRYSSDSYQEIAALSRMVDALGPDVWCQLAADLPFSWKPFGSIWAVGTIRS